MGKLEEKILSYMEHNARISIHDLAAMIGADETSVRNAIEQLQEDHVIAGYLTFIDWERAGNETVSAMIEVSVTP